MSKTFDLDIDVLTFSFFESGQIDILALFCTRNLIQHTTKPRKTNHEQSIALPNAFDLDIHVLTFSFFKSGQNGIFALFCTRNLIQHTIEPTEIDP